METKFNFKCPICGGTTLNTNVVRTIMNGRMCMSCFLKTQDDDINIRRKEYERV